MSIDPDRFESVPKAMVDAIAASVNVAPFPALVGLVLEDVRKDYSRMRLPYRDALNQPAGIVHGGAVASLIDTAVVGAIFSGFDPQRLPKRIVTIDLHVHYLSAGYRKDLICHAAVRRRGKRIIFLEADVLDADGAAIAHGELSYMVVLDG